MVGVDTQWMHSEEPYRVQGPTWETLCRDLLGKWIKVFHSQIKRNVSFIPVRKLVSKKIIETCKKCRTRTDLSTSEDTTGKPPNKKCLPRRLIGQLAGANTVKCVLRTMVGGRPLVHCNHQLAFESVEQYSILPLPPDSSLRSCDTVLPSPHRWQNSPYFICPVPCLLVGAPLSHFLIDYCGSSFF